MRVETKHLVSYAVQFAEEASSLKEQQKAVQLYLAKKNNDTLANISPYRSYSAIKYSLQNEFIEEISKKSKKFNALEKALIECKRTGAVLVIASKQIKQLIKNNNFTQLLLRYRVPFNCTEQPNLTLDTLPAILDFLEAMSKGHSEIIRKALESARGPLGNPNALKEITKVNKPKSENAVMFALMLAPIIHKYRKDGLSQRKIVEALNSTQYLAPEGGQWVLSQLQKVLERIELNTIALNCKADLDEFDKKQYTTEQRIKALNIMNVSAPGRGQWDENSFNKVVERISMIDEILNFNQFVLEVYPDIHQDSENNLSFSSIARKLKERKISVPKRIQWEITHQNDINENAKQEEVFDWTSDVVEIAVKAAKRRLHDIQHFMHRDTLTASQSIISELQKI